VVLWESEFDTGIMNEAIRLFRNNNIEVLEPGKDKEYDRAIAVSNLIFRFSVPDCVIRPVNAAQVQVVVREAKSRKLRLVIKGNGHSYAGHSTASRGSISLDLRKMETVELDKNSWTVAFDAGCQWGRVYQTLVTAGYEGRIIVGGRCPTVGVSGFILGGGLGPFTRSFGMGSDNLLEASLVTADGELVTVKKTDPPESKRGKLFWALCGAGGGNFGVVVKMRVKVEKLRSENVVAGRYAWFPEGGFTNDTITTMNEFYTADWPDTITIDSNWMCDLPSGNPCIRFTIAFNGNKSEYDKIVNRHIRQEALKVQLTRRVLAEKSTRFLYETLFNQWFEETVRAYPENKGYELYSSFVFTNERSIIEKVTASFQNLMGMFQKDFKNEKVSFWVTWVHTGGKATEREPTDSAFYWREAVFQTYVTVQWSDKWLERDMRGFLGKVKKEIRPLSLNGEAAFINFPDRDFPRSQYERFYFGDNCQKLREIKQIWDPGNFFDWPQVIQASGVPFTGGEDEEEDEEDKTDRIASEQWLQYKESQWEHYKSVDFKAEGEWLAQQLGLR
jgi:hypothetical protein